MDRAQECGGVKIARFILEWCRHRQLIPTGRKNLSVKAKCDARVKQRVCRSIFEGAYRLNHNTQQCKTQLGGQPLHDPAGVPPQSLPGGGLFYQALPNRLVDQTVTDFTAPVHFNPPKSPQPSHVDAVIKASGLLARDAVSEHGLDQGGNCFPVAMILCLFNINLKRDLSALVKHLRLRTASQLIDDLVILDEEVEGVPISTRLEPIQVSFRRHLG